MSPPKGEHGLTRQQHKSDAKQKGVYDKRHRDAACYPFIIIKMEKPRVAVRCSATEQRYHLCIHEVRSVSNMHMMVCGQCLNPCDMHIMCTHADSKDSVN
ncbi:hypothetical protein F2P81_023305 [Scophthalmus maximus]|uniref:Uncharacterized protein n=1 Tax=Scophthalmus maximus TaxID=52904 RepID=A0A6A4RR45_SCOMX|nr:hypothetical protein F2P81_023305 [Scophthalmus maximus]